MYIYTYFAYSPMVQYSKTLTKHQEMVYILFGQFSLECFTTDTEFTCWCQTGDSVHHRMEELSHCPVAYDHFSMSISSNSG